jgi:hypothetical protein
VSPWLIVTTGWPGVALEAGRSLAGTGSRLLVLTAGALAVAASTLGWLMLLRHRNRTSARRRSTS